MSGCQLAMSVVVNAQTRKSPENTIGAHEDPVRALSKMNTNGKSRLMVVEKDRLLGVITLKDMLKFLSLKMELGEHRGSER